jgi:hypothetical protein
MSKTADDVKASADDDGLYRCPTCNKPFLEANQRDAHTAVHAGTGGERE